MSTHHITVPRDHASFEGHFPGHPILPGVVLLDYALGAIVAERGIKLSACELGIVKFLHTVLPGDELSIELDTSNPLITKFSITTSSHVAATGSVKHDVTA
jgi:3-hydroxyacyl-[acyl-carrier-protein] dehydratase